MPIKGKPLLDYIIEKLNKIDEIDEIFLVSNAKFYDQFFEWKSTIKSRIPITLLNNGVWQNEFRKGRVNDIVSPFPKGILDDIIIVLGDNFFNFELNRQYAISSPPKLLKSALKLVKLVNESNTVK